MSSAEFNKFRWHEVAVRLTKGIAAQVVGVMFDRASMDGTGVYINNAKLAQELGCSTKSVERATRQVVTSGLARRERRGHNINGANRTSSEYTLTMQSQPDIPTGHPGVNRTSVSSQPDTSVRLIDPGNRPGSLLEEGNRTSQMSGGDRQAPVAGSEDGSDPKESEPSEDVSSSVGTSQDVPQPATTVSGVSTQPATEGTSTVSLPDPFAYGSDDDYYGALADAHVESLRRQPQRATFEMGKGQFVGPETDPATGGPNWAQGPRQLPFS